MYNINLCGSTLDLHSQMAVLNRKFHLENKKEGVVENSQKS